MKQKMNPSYNYPKPLLEGLCSGKRIFVPELNGYYTFFRSGDFYINRTISSQEQNIHTDIFGKGSTMFLVHAKKGQLSARKHDGNLIPVEGKIFGYMPPKSVVEWHIGPGRLSFEMFITFEKVPAHLPGVASIFKVSDTEDFEKLARRLWETGAETRIEQDISRQNEKSSVFTRARDIILENYTDTIMFNELAAKLNTSQPVLTRQFKSACGLTPLKYLNKIRILNSVKRIGEGNYTITGVGHNSGFSDIRLFFTWFKRIYGATPKMFYDKRRKHSQKFTPDMQGAVRSSSNHS